MTVNAEYRAAYSKTSQDMISTLNYGVYFLRKLHRIEHRLRNGKFEIVMRVSDLERIKHTVKYSLRRTSNLSHSCNENNTGKSSSHH